MSEQDPAALVARAKELVEKATPGPWEVWTSCSWRRIGSRSNGLVCEPIAQRDGHPDLHFRNGGFDGPDAALIAAAPTLIADLASALEAALARERRRIEERREKRSEDLFCDLASEGAEAGLLALMTGISEEHWAASWMHGLEFALWRAVEGGPRGYGMSEISERQIRLLRLLSEEADGWWRWVGNDGPRFVRLEDWREIARAALAADAKEEDVG